MSLSRRIAWNTLLQIIGRTAGTFFGLAAFAVLTRYLGTDGYGSFTIVTGFLQFFGILVDLGLTLTMVQMISAPGADERKLVGNFISLRMVSGLIFFGLAPLVGLLFPYSPAEKMGLAVGSLAFFCMSQSQLLVGIFQKYLAMSRAAVAEVAGRAGLFLGVVLASRLEAGLLGAVWALVLGNLLQLLLSFFFSRRLVRFGPRWERSVIREILGKSWPIGLSIVFNLVYLKGDVVVMSLFRSQSEIGLYGAAYKVLDLITVIPMMFMGLVLPLLVASWQGQDFAAFRRRLQKSFDFLALLALPIAGGAVILGRELMSFVAGEHFRFSGDILKILIVAALAVFFSVLFGHVIVAIGRQRQAIWGYGLDAGLTILGYFLLIPRWGAPAAAWMTVFAEVFIALFTFVLVFRVTKIMPRQGTFSKGLLATVLMMLVLLALPPWPVLWLILVGTVVYGAMLVVLRAIPREMIEEMVKPEELGISR